MRPILVVVRLPQIDGGGTTHTLGPRGGGEGATIQERSNKTENVSRTKMSFKMYFDLIEGLQKSYPVHGAFVSKSDAQTRISR